MYCHQCFGSNNDPNKCQVESCELRFKETGNFRKPKMTREEAQAIYMKSATLVEALEKFGLLKFDEEKEVEDIFIIRNDGSSRYIWGDTNRHGKRIGETYGTVKLELWPEGLVLWVDREIKWKSWETYFTPQQLYDKQIKATSPAETTAISIFGYTLVELLEIIKKKGAG